MLEVFCGLLDKKHLVSLLLYPCMTYIPARNNNDGVLFYFPISVMKWLLAFFFCLFVSGRY